MFVSSTNDRSPSRYCGLQAVLTTKHEKAKAIALPLKAGLGLNLETIEVDTDALGTFTGEIERQGTPKETAIKKARLGMRKSGCKIGLANEGSFGPHPLIPFIPGSQEVLVFIDDELGFELAESIISERTNYRQITAKTVVELDQFLAAVKFPSHGLIVRPAAREQGWLSRVGAAISGKNSSSGIVKGIQDMQSLSEAVEKASAASRDGLAQIETDMRAHMNPTRQKVIRALAVKLARRLRSLCSICTAPGFGLTGSEGNLPCEECGYPSQAPAMEVHSCTKCNHKLVIPRQDGITGVEPTYCDRCNP